MSVLVDGSPPANLNCQACLPVAYRGVRLGEALSTLTDKERKEISMEMYRYVILGGGMAAGYAAQEMVARGVQPGELAIISADTAPPYERPPLSKGFLAGTEEACSLAINSPSFYTAHGIEMQLEQAVVAVDLQRRLLQTHAGGTIGFDRLLIATGGRVRRLNVPGAGLPGIHYLRTLDDATCIRAQAARATRAVVIGAGFIGMEVAAVLAQRGLPTTVIFPEERIWQRVFTPAMSTFFQRYYEERGVSFLPRARVTSLAGSAALSTVITDSGQMLPADLVVAGIGVTAATEVLANTGLSLANGVMVNEYLESSEAGVYAAGDVANYYDVLSGKHRRVEHWDNAVEQGKHAARVMMGERTPFVHVPYFFSDVFDLSYEYWGDAAGADEVAYRGALDNGSFSVWWARAGRLVAAFALNRPDAERELAQRWIKQGRGIAELPLPDEPGGCDNER